MSTKINTVEREQSIEQGFGNVQPRGQRVCRQSGGVCGFVVVWRGFGGGAGIERFHRGEREGS